jgi:hypothetical protein
MDEGDDRRRHPGKLATKRSPFKGTRHKLDALRGGLDRRPKARKPSIGEGAADRLRHIKNRCYRCSILKKWNRILDLKR